MDSNILHQTAEAFADLDFSAENASLAEINARRAQIQGTIERAQARRQEIERELRDRRGPNGREIADALLQDADTRLVTMLSDSAETLQAEREALHNGLRDLEVRLVGTDEELRAVMLSAAGRASNASQPLITAIMDEMREAGERIVQGFAAVSAVALAARANSPQSARSASEGIMGLEKLLLWRRTIDVPAPIIEALQSLQGKGPALPDRIVGSVAAP